MIKILLVFLLLVILFCMVQSRPRSKSGRERGGRPEGIHHGSPDFSDWDLRDRLWKRRAYGWDWNDGYYARPYYYPYSYRYYEPYQTPTTWSQNGYLCFEDGKNGVPVKLENNQVKVALNIPNKECTSYINNPMGITSLRVCDKNSKSEFCKPFLNLLK